MKRPAVAASLFVIVIAALVVGWLRLRMESDILATLPSSLPEVKALRLLRDGFAGGTDLLIVVESKEETGTASAVQALARRLQARSDLVRSVRWAQSLEDQSQNGPALLAWALQNAAPQRLAALRHSLEGDAAKSRLEAALDVLSNSPDVARVQQVSYDPFGLLDALDHRSVASIETALFGLTSPDRTLGLLLVTPSTEVGNYKAATKWLEGIKSEVAAAIASTDAHVSFTGEPAFQSEIGGGIERDMSNTIGFTEVLIALLFWAVFRRVKPLLWIQLLVILSFSITLGLGGLLVGKLSIMSLAFAAIVLGIIVDYAALIIQEARQHPDASSRVLRRLAAPGIIAGGCTTATVFLSLLLSGLPGLAELGLLVALGVIAGLGVMLGFAPVLAAGKQVAQPDPTGGIPAPQSHRAAAWGTILLLGGMIVIFLWRGFPAFRSSAEALRPTKSEASDVWQHVQEKLGRSGEASVAVLVTAPLHELRSRTGALESALTHLESTESGFHHTLPTLLVPDIAAQQANRPILEWLIHEQPRLEREALAAGFTDDALQLWRGVMGVWRNALAKPWPQDVSATEAASILNCLLATGARAQTAGLPEGDAAALGSVSLPGSPGNPDADALEKLQRALQSQTGVTAAGWETLGGALSSLVKRDLMRQLLPILAILAVTLFITFRNVRDLILSALLLALGLGALAATMSLFRWSWNLASLAAVPLLLGTGIDYGIHLLLALEHNGNAIARSRATTGRAVFFSGMTTVIGFASLCFAGNRGIASLGLACCVGTAWILLIVLWLVPHWRVWLSRK
jgi:predicted RND superfamily exporter protein